MADNEDFTSIPSLDIGEDDFAATRPPDDLFDLEPITPAPVQTQIIPTGPRADAQRGGRGGGRGRRERGPRGGRGGNSQAPRQAPVPAPTPASATLAPALGSGVGGLSESRWGPAAGSTEAVKAEPTKEEAKPKPTPAEPLAEDSTAKESEISDSGEVATPTAELDPTELAPNGPAAEVEQEKRPEYPNRDRIGTGGVKKPKLTENELAERMAAIKLRNEKLTQAHAIAAKDEERFKEAEQARKEADNKERVQSRKKKVETTKRQKELDAEREQNRQRKLKAVGNREWDSTKTEEDYNPANNRSGYNPTYRRTAQGGVEGTISSPDASYSRADNTEIDPWANSNEVENDRGYNVRGRGRGRGRRGGDRGESNGRGRGGNRGRGDLIQGYNARPAATPAINSDADFPTLPPRKVPVMDTKSSKTEKKPAVNAGDGSLDTKPEANSSWAEQAEDAAAA